MTVESSGPNEGEKPGRRSRKPTNSKTFPTTAKGDIVADQLRNKLVEIFDAAALIEANRRRATALDSTDYEHGFDRIVNPSRHFKMVVIVADLAQAVGAGRIGYAINVYSAGSSLLPGHVAIAAGATLSGIGIALKYPGPAR